MVHETQLSPPVLASGLGLNKPVQEPSNMNKRERKIYRRVTEAVVFLCGCSKISSERRAESIRRHLVRSQCSRGWWEDHSRKGRWGEVGLSVSRLGMFRMICQLFYKLFPCLFVFFILRVSVAPKPTQTKPQAWPCIARHDDPGNRKQAQHQLEWQSQQHRLKWYLKKQHKIIALLLFKCLNIIILK